MAEVFQNLTGRWLGRYDYARGGAPVPFEADLLEEGDLHGEIREQNTFRPELGDVLTAAVNGTRTGAEVAFVKIYAGFQQSSPVYAGTVDAALNRIVGSWRFLEAPAFYGRFVMMRKPAASRAQTRARATESVE